MTKPIAQHNHCCHHFCLSGAILYPTATHSGKHFAPLAAPILSSYVHRLSGDSTAHRSRGQHLVRIRQLQWSKYHVRVVPPSCKAHMRAVVGKHERRKHCFMCTQFAVVGYRQNRAGCDGFCHLQPANQPASAYNCGLQTAKELRKN